MPVRYGPIKEKRYFLTKTFTVLKNQSAIYYYVMKIILPDAESCEEHVKTQV